jgi:uncharacterized protein YbbK (DUF523 family)
VRKLLVSACLTGSCCKYSGGSNALPEEVLAALREEYELVPVCPEFAGGLPTPRNPSERLGDRVVSSAGADVTEEYSRGAETALKLCRRYNIDLALLKARSPSCGRDEIYDGTFSKTLISGDGVTVEKLKKENIEIFTEAETDKLLLNSKKSD